ncbi:DivIVA domain-containing protein [Micromonospora endolithica]|uniref:DivIVA domain-containing protein n=1 Tax=Micromonospora endolithica TaxID=230091 RepID=A0A3A9ZAA2_9ACTN|nr:DivIVA domain-containing protein [Micromonospora endolithica]RKN44256.1 DivIVA domain-containing protein [Micromonospora endolithica]TWJ25724.1 DivIVA domain-containing protein [Micromonospora endolithica]
MLALFRRRTPHRPDRPPSVGWHRSASGPPLTAGQIRGRRFSPARRGLDPAEVYAFLHRVAGELAATRRDLVTVTEENVRIKRAPRSWQARFAPGARR